MITIIAGGRDFNNYFLMCSNLEGLDISQVVCGGARGADELGRYWASEHSIPVEEFPADWAKWGRYAGFKRNRQMALYADQLVAFWDGHSAGTRNMIQQAQHYDLNIVIIKY